MLIIFNMIAVICSVSYMVWLVVRAAIEVKRTSNCSQPKGLI